MPLEDNGGPGSAGVHWDRLFFGDEIMTANAIGPRILSNFTLTLLNLSKWYLVDFQYGSNLIWAKNSGCSILKSNYF